jgi:DHA1 family bicyclomycin/chloramphenicol resistance-like MFS transporter
VTRTRSANLLIILILGALSTVSPFSIDMYLPAFPQIAHDLGTTQAEISLSVSGYFVGLAFAQLFYGPLLDRFGRKPPLYAGLSLFMLASIGCATARSPEVFIAFRLLQAIGGCGAGVGALAMVRDFFPVEESAKIISLLILVISVSPLFAPTIGSLITASAGWPWIFAVLSGHALMLIALLAFVLPEGHKPDPDISLRPGAIIKEFLNILALPQFAIYAVAGAFSFAGLFVYVTGAPIIFIGASMSIRRYSDWSSPASLAPSSAAASSTSGSPKGIKTRRFSALH